MPDGAPPPLRPFGLVLHHDGSWSHEGVPIRNARLRTAFDPILAVMVAIDAAVVVCCAAALWKR